MKRMYFNLISPTRGENYSANNVLQKFFERRNFKFDIQGVTWMGREYEGGNDHDGWIDIQATTLPSLWSDSVDAEVKISVPFHRSGEGKFDMGFFATLPKSREEPEYYSEARKQIITAILNGERETIQFNWDFDSPEREQEKVQRTLSKLAEAAVFQAAMRNLHGLCELIDREKGIETIAEVNNCFTLENTKYNGIFIRGQFHGDKDVELENGVWLRDAGDGRYYDDQDNKYSEFNQNRYDADGNLISGELLGWVES